MTMHSFWLPTPLKQSEHSDAVDAQTQFDLATRHYFEGGRSHTFMNAMLGFRMATALQHDFRHDTSGYCLPRDSDDCGSPQAMTMAIKKYRQAAELGNADAQYRLGCCYLLAGDEDRDSCEALRWFRMAAKRGHISAQYNLGVREWHEAFMWLPEMGKKYEAAIRRAAKWFQLAAIGGVDHGE